jgi:RHS repeat-associated protein
MPLSSAFAAARKASSVMRSILKAGYRRRIACVILAMNLVIWPSPSLARQQLGLLISEASARVSAAAHGVPDWVHSLLKLKRKGRRDMPADRVAAVASLGVNPRKYVGHVGQSMRFMGLPKDRAGRTVQGVRLSWASSDPGKVEVNELGFAKFLNPGLTWITASAGAASEKAPVFVLAGPRRLQTDAEWDAEQAELNPDGTLGRSPSGLRAGLSSMIENLSPTAYAQSGGGDSGDMGFDGLWNNPANLVGHPANRISEQTHIGTVLPESSNFNLSIPISSLPQRGNVPLDLSLSYNSQLWSTNGSSVVFNALNTWPYLGFTLGFGRIVTYASGSNTSYLLVDGDGTRHFLGTGPASPYATYTSNDGSHITYFGDAAHGGTLYYPNGMSAGVEVINNRLLVTGVSDTNGNSWGVGYQLLPVVLGGSCGDNSGRTYSNWHTAISQISDTLGRIIQFNYDNCNNLYSITAPGVGGTIQDPVTVTVAEFDYSQVSFSPTFSSSVTAQNVPSTVLELQHVFFPVSQTGYQFFYSPYGPVYNVSKQVSMSLNPNGGINSGTTVASAQFNYPTTNSSLSGPPAFTTRTETPGSSSPFQYSTITETNTLTIVVTPPNGGSSNPGYPYQFFTRSTNSAVGPVGLLIEIDLEDYRGEDFQKTVFAYANDPGGEPQVQSVTTTNDAGQSSMVAYTYDAYGNVTEQQDYGFQVNGNWVVQRQTVNAYLTTSSYISAYIQNRVIEKQVYDMTQGTNGTVVAETTYAYDNYAAMGNMENYGGNYGGGSAPPGYNANYNNQSLMARGNLTGTTYYSNIANNVSESFDNKIDIFGNVVQAQVSCCNLNSYTFASDTYWSSPDSVTKGGSIQLTALITHDFNTSLTTQTTDPNSLQTSYSYDNSNRPTQTAYPTSAAYNTTYTDSALTVANATNFSSGGGSGSVTTSTVSDGWGRSIQSVNSSGGQVNTSYDPFDRAITVSNPFAVGGSPTATTTTTYDPLGRPLIVTLPDGNTTQTSYNGATTTYTDQVGRLTQTQNDGFGRLISVTQQGPTGALNLTANYSYDMLNNVTLINYGGQVRAFKYDALSRKIYERLPEQSSTINDGTGTMWSRAYTYTSFDKVATRTDARGVVTTYAYDPINRLSSVSYNTSSATGVAQTNNVTYTYDTSTTSTTQGLLLSVSMTGPLPTYQETRSYDNLERLSSVNWTRDGQSYTTSYQYNTANEVTQRTYPDGRVVGVTYAGNGTVSSVGGYLSNMSYNVAGLKTGITLGNGVTETFGYDMNYRMHLKSQTATTSGGASLINLNYYYQAAAGGNGPGTNAGDDGQIVAINSGSTINGGPESAAYTWDLQRRLATATETSDGQTITQRFDYDQWGNRLDEYNALSGGTELEAITLAQTNGVTNNQIQMLTSAGGSPVTFTYDANGNLTYDGNHTYQYDAENRIKQVDNATTASYAYDYRNRRVLKSAGGIVTHYIWDHSRVLAEAPSSGQVQDYVYAANLMLGVGSGGGFTFYLSDRLNIRVLTDEYGQYQGQQYHDPFGADFAESGAQDKHHLTTYERDAEASTDYALNREYEFNLGRFMSTDPIADAAFRRGKSSGCSANKGAININNPQSLNLYTYTLNDPIDSSDRTGLETDSPCDNSADPGSTAGDNGGGYPDDPGGDDGPGNPFLPGAGSGPGMIDSGGPIVSPCMPTGTGNNGNNGGGAIGTPFRITYVYRGQIHGDYEYTQSCLSICNGISPYSRYLMHNEGPFLVCSGTKFSAFGDHCWGVCKGSKVSAGCL